MVSTAFLLAASMVVGQAEAEPSAEPDFNPNLAPVAWMIGEWECKKTSATGEVRAIRKTVSKWTANNQVLVTEFAEAKPDGTPIWAAVVNYYWDPAAKRIGARLFSGNFMEEQALLSANDNEMTWESRMVDGNGNQGLYKCKMIYGQDAFSIGWTKISGTGARDMGPWEHTRVK